MTQHSGSVAAPDTVVETNAMKEVKALKVQVAELSDKLNLVIGVLEEISERQEFSAYWQSEFFQKHADLEMHRWQTVEDLLNAQFGARTSDLVYGKIKLSTSPMETLKDISERHQKVRTHLKKISINESEKIPQEAQNSFENHDNVDQNLFYFGSQDSGKLN